MPLILLLARAWAIDCPTPTEAAELVVVLSRAETAFGALDAAGFSAATQEIALVLPCLGAPVAPAVAAHLHRVEGIRRSAARDQAGAAASFAAARAADPSAELPAEVAAPGSALRRAWEGAVVTGTGATRPLPAPVSGALVVDGRPGLDAPIDRPFLLQVLRPDGGVAATVLARSTDNLPYVAVAPAVVAAAPPVATAPRPILDPPLAIAGAAAAVLAGGAYAIALAERAAFDDAAGSYAAESELLAHQGAANGWTVASAGIGATAVGLVVASAITVRF